MNSTQRFGGISRAVAQSRKALGGLMERFRGRSRGATLSARHEGRKSAKAYYVQPRRGEQVILGWPFPNVPITIPDGRPSRSEY